MSENETPKWLTPPTRADLERAFARIDVPAQIEKARVDIDSSTIRDVTPPPTTPEVPRGRP